MNLPAVNSTRLGGCSSLDEPGHCEFAAAGYRARTQPGLSTFHSASHLIITIRGPNTEKKKHSPALSCLLVLASHGARKEALKFATQSFCNGQFHCSERGRQTRERDETEPFGGNGRPSRDGLDSSLKGLLREASIVIRKEELQKQNTKRRSRILNTIVLLSLCPFQFSLGTEARCCTRLGGPFVHKEDLLSFQFYIKKHPNLEKVHQSYAVFARHLLLICASPQPFFYSLIVAKRAFLG